MLTRQMLQCQRRRQQLRQGGAGSGLPALLQMTLLLLVSSLRPMAMPQKQMILPLLLPLPRRRPRALAGVAAEAGRQLTQLRWQLQPQPRACCRHGLAARQLQTQQPRWRSSWAAARRLLLLLLPVTSRQPAAARSRHAAAKRVTAAGRATQQQTLMRQAMQMMNLQQRSSRRRSAQMIRQQRRKQQQQQRLLQAVAGPRGVLLWTRLPRLQRRR